MDGDEGQRGAGTAPLGRPGDGPRAVIRRPVALEASAGAASDRKPPGLTGSAWISPDRPAAVTRRRDPDGMGGDPQPGSAASAVQFAQAARRLGAAARAAGLAVPAFRSPPRVAGAQRTLRHYPGGAVISVTLRDRPLSDVTVDMVEGLVRANRLDGDAAGRVRGALLEAARGDTPGGGLPSPGARMAERQTQAA